MIILEGPDNGGKSTLAYKFGLPVVHPGGAPKTPDEEQIMFRRQFRVCTTKIVHDRVTCISQQVYQKRLKDPYYHLHAKLLAGSAHCVIIYCRPDDEELLDFTKHSVAEHDTEEQMAYVRSNAELFVRSYDILMSDLPHIKYNYKVDKLDDLIYRVIKAQFSYEEWKTCHTQLTTTL